MACALTTGFTIDCRDSVGGVKTIYITELANKATLTEASGVVTAFTLSTGKQFWTYNVLEETSNATNTDTGDRKNGSLFSAQAVHLQLTKMQATSRNELRLLAQNRVMVIVLDRNGKYWLFGKSNGLMLKTNAAQTGTAFGDLNGYVIDMEGAEETPSPEVSSSLIATLTSPAV